MPSRFSVCNEVFGKTNFADVCGLIRDIGYSGIEIAPFTLAADPSQLSAGDRRSSSNAMERSGLAFVGLHWLLASPKSLHATTPDQQLRTRTWKFIGHLIDLCSDLADSASTPVIVFGSPQQRSAVGGLTSAEATRILTDELARAAPHAEKRGVQLLLEPLSKNQTDVVTTLEEAVAIVREIGSPAVQTMFDVHNAVDETSPHADLIKRFHSQIRHVHVNELDGREPGTGNYDFGGLLSALDQVSYQGWVSLECFEFSRDSREIASRALQQLVEASSQSLTRKI
jgi:D-psicose/D-tagatose/L-ribulose 3-epimerase